MDIDFSLSKLDLGIPLKELGLISIISLISIIFNFGAFDQDSTQYIYMALHFINQPPLEFILIASHIAILNTFVRLIRPLVPFLSGWLGNIIYLGNVPAFSFAGGYWQLPFGLVNSIFSFFSSIILYKLVYHFTENPKKSVFAVVLYNFCDIMFFNSMILIEGGTMFFAILMVYLLICKPFKENCVNSIIMGITIGLAGLTRETLLISGIILFIGYSIYKIKDLLELENFKKFLLAGIIVIVIYGGYVLSLGIKTYFDCLYVFLNLNLSNILAFFVPQSLFSRLPTALSGIGQSMINVFRYTIVFFAIGLVSTFLSDKTKDDKIFIALYLLAFFIPLVLSPFVVERFLFPFYLVSIYLCIEGIYSVDENKIWAVSIVVSIAILNLIFVVFFYPYNIWQQLTNVEVRTFLYYLILVYLGISAFILIYKHIGSKKK
ncbi:MAG: hypothetical protein ACTSRG_21305 [Candidatus Helarchaeota archaeon]